ncbi:glycosyltransferase family 4 protein [Pseudoroseomonas cervicalis]|uniref:glycosyltransferase family 4 protein n=1 Tax=Teichococcus cervicalis TaxID=204525 RepID=UPI0022F1D731|nr:glycosyltransferase family 4 protein [Pseudoroseomonas cervicalis]WBV43174.1 glycosyltransferase family 4 protein [Pseudoroseomonas cervicalis]
MRILYLHQHYSGPAGATATRSHAMATALVARGHHVTLACGRYQGAVTGLAGAYRGGRREGLLRGLRLVEFDIPCGNEQGLGARATAFGRYAVAAGQLALSARWDLVVASSTPLTVALPALLARRLRGTPFVFEIRDPWPELPRALGGVPGWALSGMGWLADAACRRAAAVVALSEGMAETALARGAAPERVHVVPNGCDLELFGPQVAPWRPAEAAPWEVLAVYAGAHGRANGLDQLLDAAAQLLAQGERRLRLLLVGEGSEKPRLREQAAARGLHNVSFLAPLPKRQLAALLAGAQIGLQCLAPLREFAEWTAPNKLMDYLAAGLPVVGNVPGRAARLLAEGPCGLSTPPDDAAALAAALRWLADHPAQRRAMGLAAREQAVRRWDRRLQAARFAEILAEAAARRAAPQAGLVPA